MSGTGGHIGGARKTDRRPIVSGHGFGAALHRWPIAILIFVLAVLRVGVLGRTLSASFNPVDFSMYYCAGLTLRHGENPYRTEMAPLAKRLGLEKGYTVQTNDPPSFLLAFEPLTLLSPHQAYWAWQAVSAAAFAASLFLLLWPGYSGLGGPMALALAGFAILFPPVGNNFVIAQSKMLVLLPLVAMMRFMERKRDGLAGLMLAVAVLLRVFPLLLGGYLVLTRRWRVLGYTIAATLAGAIVTMAIMGVGTSLSFFTAVGSLSSERWLSTTSNISLMAFVSRIVWSLFGSAPGPLVEFVRRASVISVDLVVMYLVVRATLSAGRDDREWRVFSLWIVASVMLSPTAWFHYLLLMLIPFVQMACAANRGAVRSRTLWMAVGCYLAIGLTSDVLRLLSQHPQLIEKFREAESVSLLIAFVAVYWFAVDLPDRPLSTKA
ncbi:MAG TPA: glycosyltransferase family 87 protein [Candidatus Binataceae bacterium]|nr:glycosyltransferase family 87 protein [Candidatus Binataceae bacterium]